MASAAVAAEYPVGEMSVVKPMKAAVRQAAAVQGKASNPPERTKVSQVLPAQAAVLRVFPPVSVQPSAVPAEPAVSAVQARTWHSPAPRKQPPRQRRAGVPQLRAKTRGAVR